MVSTVKNYLQLRDWQKNFGNMEGMVMNNTENISRRQFLRRSSQFVAGGATLSAASGLFANQRRPGTKRPNLLFVFADMMRSQAMGCSGNEQVITPNLDKLAAEGMRLTNAISN